MTETYKPAGTYVLNRFTLKTFARQKEVQTDIRNIVHTWSIRESMLTGSIRGTAKIYDTVGVYYDFPLRGQEILETEYTDLKGEKQSHKFFVYAVTDVSPSKSNDDAVIEYTLNFVSFGKFWSDRYSIKRCIKKIDEVSGRVVYPTITEQANTIFEDYYTADGEGTKKELITTETDGNRKMVIPNLNPESALHFLSRNAYVGDYESSLFRFFENRKNYYFVNVEEHVTFENADQFYFYTSGAVDQTPESELRKLQEIISIDLGSGMNTIEAINNGAYTSEFVELDVMSRIEQKYTYDHKDFFRDSYYPDGFDKLKLPHSDEMIDEHMNKRYTVYGIKDYAEPDSTGGYDIDPYKNYAEIYNNKTAANYHYKQSRITIQIYGSNELFAGSVVRLELPKFQTKLDLDVERSGKWLVESIENRFIENTFLQDVTLVKGGLVDG